MNDAISLDEFISLGQSLGIVANPQPWHVNLVSDEIGNLLQRLTTCGMQRARVAAQPMSGWSLPYNPRTGFITAVALKEIVACMTSVVQTLYNEAREKQVVVVNRDAVSPRLRNVATVILLTSSQTQLKDETIKSLERGANRAAIVVGWCFAYDVIRHWVFSDQQRLQSFNAELASYTKRNGARQYDDIVHYDDFFSNKAPAEGRVIEVCDAAGIINGRVARSLRHYLDVRNDYAHATASHPSANQANAFIEHLLDIITTPPFFQPLPPAIVPST